MDVDLKLLCEWKVTIVPFDVPVIANRPAVETNKYVIDPGDSITFTADTDNMTAGWQIYWSVQDLDYSNAENIMDTNTLTPTRTGGFRCIAYAAKTARQTIQLAEIKVYRRVTVTQGANGRWLRDNVDGLRFVTMGKDAAFFGICVDGDANATPLHMRAGTYDVVSDPVNGSMVLTLLPAFLATLSDGPHTLTFQYDNRENTVSTVFYVGNYTPGGDLYGDVGADVPKTGDSAPLALLCGLVLLSGVGLTVSVTLRGRKRAE